MPMRLEHPPRGGWASVEKRVGKRTKSVITALVFKKYLKMKLIFLTKPLLAVCGGGSSMFESFYSTGIYHVLECSGRCGAVS